MKTEISDLDHSIILRCERCNKTIAFLKGHVAILDSESLLLCRNCKVVNYNFTGVVSEKLDKTYEGQ